MSVSVVCIDEGVCMLDNVFVGDATVLINDVAKDLGLASWSNVDSHNVFPSKRLLLGGEFIKEYLDVGCTQ